MDEQKKQLVLGIESSCDETGVALVAAQAGQPVPTLLASSARRKPKPLRMHTNWAKPCS